MFKSFKSGQLKKTDRLKWLKPHGQSKSSEAKEKSMKNRSRSVDTKTLEFRNKSSHVTSAEKNNSIHKSYNDLDKRMALSLSPDNFEFGNDLSKVVSNIDFKTLGEKSDIEREKLNRIMKKLEEDLMNAKIDLLEEENVKQVPNLFSNISTNNTPIKSKRQNHLYNKTSLSNSYSSTLSTSTSGIVTTTGASSSSSSVSTSPPLHIQQKNLLNNKRPKTPEPVLPRNASKNIQLLIVNKPRRLPRRRHTIASRNECSVQTVQPLSTGVTLSSSSEYSLTDENDDYGYVEYSKTPKSYKKNKTKRVINENTKTVKLASKSITNLTGSIEKTSWTNPQTNLDSCLCQEAFAYASSPSRGAPIVLNLSPLSLSASSITTSDSDDEDKFTLPRNNSTKKSPEDNETLKLNHQHNQKQNTIEATQFHETAICNRAESML